MKDPGREKDLIRQIEKKRLWTLVESDIEVVNELHTEDFQLITPDGSEYTRQTYLNHFES